MPMRRQQVLRRQAFLGFMACVLVGAAAVGCGQKVNPRDYDDPPASFPGTTASVPGTRPATITGQGTTRVPGSVPRTTTMPVSIPRTTPPPTTEPTTTGPNRSTTTVVTKSGREAAVNELAKRRAMWDAKHPVAYRFKVGVGCFCPPSITGPWLVTARVDTREIVPATPGGDQPLGSQLPPDVEGVFAKAKDALAKADKVEIEYDETYGFPTKVQIDWITNAVDDEQTLTISDFTPL